MEIEVKAKVKDFRKVKVRLKKIKAKKIDKQNQVDNYYLPFGCCFNKKGRRLLRTRYNKKTKKMRLEAHRYQDNLSGYEFETEVTDKKMMENILKELKYKKVVTVEKNRQTYKYKNINIVLDKVKNLGNFVEVELLGQANQENKNKVLRVIDDLNISRKNIIWHLRYHAMLMKKKGYDNFYF